MSVQKKSFQSKYLSLGLGSIFLAAVTLGLIVSCTGGEAKAKPNFVFKEAPRPGVVAKIAGQEVTEDAGQRGSGQRSDVGQCRRESLDHRVLRFPMSVLLARRCDDSGSQKEVRKQDQAVLSPVSASDA